MLANNVTQAQAFCIATACLQVPVLSKAPTKSNPFEIATSDLYYQSNHFDHLMMKSKFNLFKPSTLFGGLSRQQHQPVIEHYPAQYPSHRHHFGTLKGSSSRFKKNLLPRDYNRQIKLTRINGHDRNDSQMGSDSYNASPQVTELIPVGPTSEPLAPTSSPLPPPASTTATAVAPLVTTQANLNQNLNMIAEETIPAAYPNFNQIYSQIYNAMAGQRRPLVWRPPDYYPPPSPNVDRQQPGKLASNLQTAATRVANLMHSVGNNLRIKKTDLLNRWPFSPSSSPNNMMLPSDVTRTDLNRYNYFPFRFRQSHNQQPLSSYIQGPFPLNENPGPPYR